MAHEKTETWTCDVPGCDTRVHSDPFGYGFFGNDRPHWELILRHWICPNHQIQVDGHPVVWGQPIV